MAASSSSSSTTIVSSTYDVFLNFRGEDTRNTFTSFLHKALKEKTINAFLDSKSLRTGDSIDPTLLAAIEGSKIWIPILSEGYAESKWCLNELVQIVKCKRSSGQLILPIFFFVDPSNVRRQNRGSFAKAFQKHENDVEPDVVESWRDSLKEVGHLSGEVVDGNKDQSDIVESVVQRVLRELHNKTLLAESERLMGIDSSANNLLSLLDLDCNDVQFVGIWGIGGIGKTTIANTVYSRILSRFNNKHSFISDIREKATSNTGLVSLQQQLLKDILGQGTVYISNCYQGKQWIKEKLGKEKVLIVLDDVDSVEQIGALTGGINWFGPGSRVIITTRDEKNLINAKVISKIYKLQELNHYQSLRLFSLQVFSSEQPPNDYMLLSNDVAHYSGGLPLTLEVFGSWLSERTNTKMWESTIQCLKETHPEEVRKRLWYSYDKLEGPNLKEMFLDAAFFFIGWRKKNVIPIWDACDYHPSVTISRLIQRSLIKFEDGHDRRGTKGSILKMHDQIRDMGREIVLEENRMDPSKRSRLWSSDEIMEVLERKTGTLMAKGMVLGSGLSDVCLDQQHFDMMPNLKFLEIDSPRVKGNFFRPPSTLKCFRWTSCSWESIPDIFYHKDLVHLKLQKAKIKQAWNSSPQDENKRFLKLKVLNLAFSRNLSESPKFSWFPYLKELDLSGCKTLESLHESIGELRQLQTLDIGHCSRIMELPNSICKLKSLVTFRLSNTGIKKLPTNLDSLSADVVGIEEVPYCTVGLSENLEELDISHCCNLVELPRSMGRLRCLRTLGLEIINLSKLPDDFSLLSNLEDLSMSVYLKDFQIDLSHFRKLRRLKFSNCKLLEELPKVSSSLVVLLLVDCHSLVRTLDLSRLSHLKALTIWRCKQLKGIQGLEGAESLERIDVIDCPDLTDGTRNIHEQGRLLLPKWSQTSDYRLSADSNGLSLCVVLESFYYGRFQEGELVHIQLEIAATIHRNDKAIKCKLGVRFEDVEFTNQQDVICIHHFKGLDWFGIPLQETDSIMIRKMDGYYVEDNVPYTVRVKFWELL